MGELLEELSIHRKKLNLELDQEPEHVRRNWISVEPLIHNWWTAYKKWEGHDSFNKAFRNRRMTVRTFPGGRNAFAKQVSKEFKRGTINVVSSPRGEPEVRIFSDSQYTPMDPVEAKRHDDIFHKTAEYDKYLAKRGIDSSAFANPANFATREKKYDEGLHDLSASLLNPELSIFNQIHNTDAGAHFSFMPLSKEDDQLMLYRLIRCAKGLRLMLPALYDKVRMYRAEMTRVKLANEFDMGIVYSAVPVANPGHGPAYKLRYGLGRMTTITGDEGQKSVPVTAQIYAERQQAALRFKSIIGIRDAKNEIVIAIRQHAGGFPVYAIRNGETLDCYDIVGNQMALNGKKISSTGVMTGG